MLIKDFNGRDNNFNLVRFLLAFSVLFGHSFPLSGTSSYSKIFDFFIGPYFGIYAVNIFFGISGFLVTKSLLKNQNIIIFFRSRCYRLFPALIAAAFICAFIMGPCVTNLGWIEYYSDLHIYNFFITHSFALQKDTWLPGVFQGNPYPDAVNGSLWSLRYEIRMYFMLSILSILGILTVRMRFYYFLLLFVAAWAAFSYAQHFLMHYERYLVLQRVSLYFVCGMAFQFFSHKIKLNIFGFFLLLLLLVVCINTFIFDLVLAVFCMYFVFCLVFLPKGRIRNFNHIGDVSYGFYIYAFPVQQVLVYITPTIGFWALVSTATVVTLVFALLSWYFIESPSLNRCKRINVQA